MLTSPIKESEGDARRDGRRRCWNPPL